MSNKVSAKTVLKDSGYIFSKEEIDAAPFTNNEFISDNLPPILDLRRFMTKIESQGGVGSCTANAVSGAYEYLVKRYNGASYDVSRLFIYYNARLIGGKPIADNGSAIRHAIESLKVYGACSETTYPYLPELVNHKPPQHAYDEAASFLIQSVEKIEIDLMKWKSVLASGFPIIFALRLYDSFDKHRIKGLVTMPSKNEKGRNNRTEHALHAMLCVGYSDRDRLFIVRNSWGNNWGDEGYCYIPYDYLINGEYNLGDNWIIKRLDNFEDKKEEYWDYDKKSIMNENYRFYNRTALDLFKTANSIFWALVIGIFLFTTVQAFFAPLNSEEIKNNFLAQKSEKKEKNIIDPENKKKKEEGRKKENNKQKENTREKEKKEDKKKEEADSDKKFYTWNWRNHYNGKNEKLEFSIKYSDYQKSIKNRQATVYSGVRQVYSSLYENDKVAFESFLLAVKEHCEKNRLDYTETLEFVISAIQTIPYTLVTMGNKDRCPCTLSFGSFLDDCSARNDRKGCCNDIEPFAVFSPIEFAVQKTGDCDTRTLFAFTILSELNYDVTILNSEVEGHSIFGVNSPKPLGNGAFIMGINRKKYYIWELTSTSPPGIYSYKSSISTWHSIFK